MVAGSDFFAQRSHLFAFPNEGRHENENPFLRILAGKPERSFKTLKSRQLQESTSDGLRQLHLGLHVVEVSGARRVFDSRDQLESWSIFYGYVFG